MHGKRKNVTKEFGNLNFSEEMACYLILIVPIVGFLVFILYPYLWAGKWSFFNYTGVASQTRFVGWENFINIFTKDKSYWHAWLVTLKFTMLKLPIEIPLALLLATILQKDSLRGKGIFRSVYYLPSIISVAIVGAIFSNLFDFRGVINSCLMRFNIIQRPIDWFADYSTSMAVLLTASIWLSFGVNVLYFMAALSNVPVELYEAASVEGAGRIRKFFSITLPMIAPVFQTILLLAINGTLQTGEFIIVLSNGAPGGTTFTVGAYLINAFDPGFATGSPNIGYGSALSLVTSVFYCLIAVAYMKVSTRLANNS